MNILFKRFIAVFLSLSLIFGSTIQTANAASGWSITGVTSAGARAIVSATKGGYKSAVNIAPSVGRLALGAVRVGNGAALLYAAAQLAEKGIDFVMDPANNQIKYKESSLSTGSFSINYGTVYPTPEQACKAFASSSTVITYQGRLRCAYSDGSIGPIVRGSYEEIIEDKTIPLSSVAPRVLSNAANGHAASQKVVREVAAEMVATGDFDQDLLSGAVPINDSRPVIPAVPGSQNGNTAPGDTTSGATPGEQSQAAKDAAEAAKKSAQAAAEAAKAAAEEARRAADEAKDLINQEVDQAIKDAAKAAADAAAKAAKDAKEVADAAAEKAAEAAKEAVRQAEKERDIARDKTKEAEEALKKAKEEGTKTQEEIGELERALEKAKEEATKAKERADEAAKEAEKAKAEAAKPFELPAFCSWATPVCDAVDWLMKPHPDLEEDTEVNVEATDITPVDTDINFGGSCPAPFEFNGSIFGNSINIVLLDTTKFCGFLSTFVKFPVYASSSLFALYILGGRKDG